MNLRKLNHILIPTTKGGRDRLRRTPVGRLAGPVVWIYLALSREGRFLLVVALLAGFAGLDVSRSQNYILWAFLAAPLTAAFVLRFGFALKNVDVQVITPARIALGRTAEVTITVRNHGDRDQPSLRVQRPLLPWDGEWTGERAGFICVPAGEHRSVNIGARFGERGLHQLDSFYVASLVPMGLTLGKGVERAGGSFLVVPKIAAVERLELPMQGRYQQGGVALASKTGESAELLGVRPYAHGDRIRDLHSRTWARVGSPVVREYQQEYFSRIGVVLDAGDASPRELEAAVSLAAGVVAKLTRGEALIDVLVADGEVHPLTLGRGLGFLEQALDHLALVTGRVQLEPERLVQELRPYLTRLSSVVLVATRFGPPQRLLLDRIRGTGLSVRVVIVSEEPVDTSDVVHLRPESIESGDGISIR